MNKCEKELKKLIKELEKKSRENKGWVCPVCGAVMAPTQNSCVNCTGIPQYPIQIQPAPFPPQGICVYATPFPDVTITYGGGK